MPGLPSRTRAALAWPAAAAAFALWHLPLALAPGWFSHDELQWQARAAVDSLAALPFSDWGALDRFQWRPLTFDLWLLLAWLGGGSPARMHALWLALGFALCALLYGTLRRAGVPARRAAAGAAAFATSPAAAYVHGWTATLAELLWVGLALALAWVLFGAPAAARRTPALAAGAAVGLALLCKEAALALPALLALAAWLRPEAARWRAALLGSLVPAALYLAARGALLLHAPRPEGAYAWSLAALPARWTELQLWPFLPTALEFPGVWSASAGRPALAATLALALAAVAFRHGRRIGIAYLAGGALALGPAIALMQGYPQYVYGATALACALLAAAPPGRAARVVLALAALVSAWHGLNVQRELHRVGTLEARFTPALRQALAQAGDAPLALHVERAADAPYYRRLAMPSPHLPPGRVRWVEEVGAADAQVRADGTLAPPP